MRTSAPHMGRRRRSSGRQHGGTLAKVVLGGVTLASAAVTLGLPSASAGAAARSASAGAAASAAPGVTKNSITVGTISTQTGTLAANFGSLIYGEKAYFNYINAQGGVNGRKINYRYQLDDGGNPSQFNQLVSTLINQDHVFAVTGVASAFFTPNLFVEAKIPTYGYNVSNNWAGPNNLFAAGGGGSTQYLPGGIPEVAYLVNKVHAKSVAVLAYGIAASAASCQTDAKGLTAAGIKVSYTDYKIAYPGTTVATDVQRMKQAGADFVLSCMDVQGNVTMARAIKQYGLKATQFWLSGNDQSTLNQNESLMQNVYFYIAHVPFLASQTVVPGSQAVPLGDEQVRAQVRHRRGGHSGLGVRGTLRPRSAYGGQQSHPGQRDQADEHAHDVQRRRIDHPDELEGCRALRSRTPVLRVVHPGAGHQVRAGPQHLEEERVRLLRHHEREEPPAPEEAATGNAAPSLMVRPRSATSP